MGDAEMSGRAHHARTFVDRGGTFTDVVTVDEGGVSLRKVPSDHAVVGALARGHLTFGTTVATNALLERRGVRVLLLVNEGWGDLPVLRHMARPALFDPDAAWPPSLASRVVEVRGRLGADGHEVQPLELPDPDLDEVDAVAVVLLHATRNPAHELAVGTALRARRPDLHVVLGHQVVAEPGYLARVETALVDAAITPVLQRALRQDAIPTGALAIRSDASLVEAQALRAPDAVLSGPAGGVLAVREVARLAGFEGAIGLDMGGTSTDVCFVRGDVLPRQPVDRAVAGVFLRRPMLAVDTIAAGGGSVLRGDGPLLRVGPQSAGADPGPQCYGRGGPPTVTDAALACGLIDAGAFTPPLRPEQVRIPGDPAAFLAVAHAAMAAAVQRLAGSWGVDPQDWPLVAYGGAAGQHAAAVAARAGVRVVLIHPLASGLSAWGQALAVREEERARAVWGPLVGADLPAIVSGLRVGSPALPLHRVQVGLRYRGTDTTIHVPWEPDDEPSTLLRRLASAHSALFGFVGTGEVDLVDVRLRSSDLPSPPPVPAVDPWGVGDQPVPGPRLFTGAGTSIHVPAGWTACWRQGLLRLDHTDAAPAIRQDLATWWTRLTSVAERAGEHLARLARSVSIRERRDFSCALFDGEGQLVVNAPHVPVHLGAMGETVRDLLTRVEVLGDGEAWLSNDPQAGGSHLPDLTVITCVVVDGHRFFVASRGHHVDVGGATPGSMPPRATHIDEEGVVLRAEPLLDQGRLRAPPALLGASRQPETVASDLAAQVAANALAARLLTGLGSGAEVASAMTALLAASEQAMLGLLPKLQPGGAAEGLDGVALEVQVIPEPERLVLDLSGCAGPHPGNLNAPRAVVRAAVLYVLRVLIGEDLPLNEGALRRVHLIIPPGSIIDPPVGAAVAGGNVETSQRLVDLLLRALGRRAASQGTMNNLTLGGEGWSLYETLGGGLGASAEHDGVSGRQVHMTNTRATDPEIAELRLPVRIWRCSLRRGSGGDGLRRGGDGLVREIEVLAPATASLLAAWRPAGAPGLDGGRAGAPGRATLLRGGAAQPWDGATTSLAPGDRVRVETPGGGGWGSS